MTAALAQANYSSAYSESLPKQPKKPVKKRGINQALQANQTVEARKKQYQLQQQRIAQTNARARYGQSGCYSFFDCLRQKKPPQQRRATTASLSGLDRQTRSTVAWKEAKYAPGTIIVKTPERALYYVLPDGKALRYDVGVGKEGFQWSGNSKIVMKKEWPSWRPPQQMIEREAAKGHIIPEFMEGGPDNPLGARAMYIGGTLFRIHGTNNAASIGGAVSSGCIRMMNADVIDLYDRVKVGSRVYVYQ
ncbi:MAG: L,D-transpeptidase [Rhizobiales bacterium]|nr:L,D-transpeptidase [Hyphomicrobiales bacterium]